MLTTRTNVATSCNSWHLPSCPFLHLWSVCVQALALPMFYDSNKMGCTIPDQAYGGHSAPTVDETVRLLSCWPLPGVAIQWPHAMVHLPPVLRIQTRLDRLDSSHPSEHSHHLSS